MIHRSDLLEYDSIEGTLIWLPRPRSMFGSDRIWRGWNSKFAGKAAGNKKKFPGTDRPMNWHVSIHWVKHCAHRVIWEMVNGPIPDGHEIDHIDGNPWNNKLNNLRLATRSQNCFNKSVGGNCKVRARGVRLENGRYSVRVTANRKTIYAGSFLLIEDAVGARNEAARKIHGEYFKPSVVP